MPMPSSPKDAKPKTDNIAKDSKPGSPAGGMDGSKLLIANTVTTVIICILFIGVNYFVQTNFMNDKFTTIMQTIGGGEEGEGEGAEGEGDEVQRGLILDLGDFVLNLSDVSARRYLKANVAIELTKKASDPDPNAPAEGGEGGHGGGHGEGAPADPMQAIQAEMEQFKPSIRDAVISTLSSKTSDELSSIAGKEEAKEQIKEAVNAIFAGEREVLRVSFGNFIIQ
jgi:flagellar FliL protein